jgi:hypothetical protein
MQRFGGVDLVLFKGGVITAENQLSPLREAHLKDE